MLRQPERPVVRCSAVWTNVSAWPLRTAGAAGVTWGDGLGKGDLGRLGGSGLEPIQHSGPLCQMTWHIPYHHGRLMSAIHTPCSHCDTTDSMRQEHTYGNQQR